MEDINLKNVSIFYILPIRFHYISLYTYSYNRLEMMMSAITVGRVGGIGPPIGGGTLSLLKQAFVCCFSGFNLMYKF